MKIMGLFKFSNIRMAAPIANGRFRSFWMNISRLHLTKDKNRLRFKLVIERLHLKLQKKDLILTCDQSI